jgi:hypothetical protein
MRTTPTRFSLVSTSLVLGFMCTLALAGSLDEKSFSGNVGMMGQKADKPDEITFANGQFSSSGCKEYGFSGREPGQISSHFQLPPRQPGCPFHSPDGIELRLQTRVIQGGNRTFASCEPPIIRLFRLPIRMDDI